MQEINNEENTKLICKKGKTHLETHVQTISWLNQVWVYTVNQT